MKQEIINISVKDLVLWTENPRDPIDPRATDAQIVQRALEDKQFKWEIEKLSKGMGDYFDFSELPTIVYHGKKPVVYDGNRRVIIAKLSLGLIPLTNQVNFSLPSFPMEMPCNVCEKKIALQNIYRKHSDSGSWQPLERDIFLHKFMGKEKSPFLIIEEDTGLISANPYLNQRFVKEEIFKEEILKTLGFSTNAGKLKSIHSNEDAYSILEDISEKVKNKTISTRENRGKVIEVLSPYSQQIIDANKPNRKHINKIDFSAKEADNTIRKPRQTKRIQKKGNELFGGKLYLRIGDTSNLYRDIIDLYEFYLLRKDELSQSFPGLIRMSLRLLCETAAREKKLRLDNYITKNFEDAKKKLDQNVKTTLAGQNVTETSLVQLLHTGAHNYQSSTNMEQTIAMSVIIGAILQNTNGKD